MKHYAAASITVSCSASLIRCSPTAGSSCGGLTVVTAESFSILPDDLDEIIALLPGTYTRQRLCDQLNSAIGGHAWGQVYGTVE